MSVFSAKPSQIISNHSELRKALRDTATYSSDLQGDADVRNYRQIPLEIDPPRHHLYRNALAPFFVKPTIEQHLSSFRNNADTLITSYFNGEQKDAVSQLALPLVMRNLGVIYNRLQDVEEWISWGPDVWTANSKFRDGAVLHGYLDRVYEEALSRVSSDIWQEIAYLEIDGAQISAEEFRGIAGVLLAGGRDTVVKLLTGILWHLGKTKSDLQKLRQDCSLVNQAIPEFLRYFSPLPLMNRTTVPESGQHDMPSDRYVGMSFIAANFDESVFESPFEINFDRSRNPHLSFGFGPHTCLGNHVAELEAKVFLEALIKSDIKWKIAKEKITFHSAPFDQIPETFHLIEAVTY